MKKRSDFIGTELDWFARDSEGFVALMSSAGYGPIPDCVFEQFDQQRQIEEFLAGLAGQRRMAEWDQMVHSLPISCVFVYDWKLWDGPYRRRGLPSVPRQLERLGFPPGLRDALPFLPVRFSASAELRSEQLPSRTG